MTSPWGPFLPGLDHTERVARLRSLRLAVKLLTGPRGKDASYALLKAEVSGADPEALGEASAAFDSLPPLDRRKVLASLQGLL